MGRYSIRRIGIMLLVVGVVACGESPVESPPTQVVLPEDALVAQNLIQRGSAVMGYEAPELAVLDQAHGVQVCATWVDTRLAEGGFDPDHLSFDFEIREPSEEDGGSPRWQGLASAQVGSVDAHTCLEISTDQMAEAQSGLEEGEAWLQVKGVARTGQGRTTLVHHTEHALLVVGEPEGPPQGGEVSGSLGPEGGQLELLGDDGELLAALTVPDGALASETTLTIRSEADPDAPAEGFLVPGTAVFLSPSGTQFDTPVILTIPLDPDLLPEGTQPEELQIHRVEADGTTTPQPSTVDLDAGTVTAELSSFSLYAVYNFPPMVVWVGGAAPDPRDWHNPENWTGAGGAPTEFLSAFINAGESHYPRISGSMGSVRSLTIEAGTSLELDGAGLSVYGSLTADGLMSAGAGESVILDGDGLQTLQGNLPNLWVAGGTRRLSGNVRVAGNLMMTGLPSGTPPTLDVGGHVLDVGGDLTLVTGHPTHLRMTESVGRVVVRGNASFGAPWVGETPLRAGTLELHGNLRQIGDASAFSPGNNHWTLFAGGEGVQTVDFEHSGAGESGFGMFELGATEEVLLLTDARARALVFSDEGVGARLSGEVALDAEMVSLRGPVSIDELRVGRSLVWSGHPYLVPRTVFRGTDILAGQNQPMAAIPYQDVIIDGGDLELEDEFVTVAGNLHILSGSFHVTPQRLLTVGGDLIREGGRLHMDHEDDRLVVHGTVDFRESVGTQDLRAGRLWIGGDVMGLYGAAEEHFTILFGSDRQDLLAPGMGSLAVTNFGEGVYFHTDALPLRFLDLVGNSRILQDLYISVIHVNFRSTSSTHFEPGAAFNCTTGWREPDAESNGGCDPPLAEQHGQLDPDRRPDLDFYTLPSALQASITSPEPGHEVAFGEPVSFSATASLDGSSVPATFTWSSGTDGELGTGANITAHGLSAGVHLIWLLAETADGLSARDWITVHVRAPQEGMPAAAVATGHRHSCALDDEGRAWCWGRNGSGQVGDGTTEERATPTAVQTSQRFSVITTGYAHTCAINLAGEVFCWGRGPVNSLVPLEVVTDVRFVEVAAGGFHTCAIAMDDRMHCWGIPTRSLHGQLGLGEEVTATTPMPVVGAERFVAVDVGDFHSCGVTQDGRALCWGMNDQHQIGSGSEEATIWEPTEVVGGLRYMDIAAGERHSCAVANDGTAYCWGRNEYGERGVEELGTVNAPVPVAGGLTFRSVEAGHDHTCAVTSGNSAYCWGARAIGHEEGGPSRIPALVAGDLEWETVDGGWRHSCGLTTAGRLHCWGSNPDGALGTGTGTSHVTPEPVATPTGG